MPAERLAPDVLLLQTNLTGAVTDVDEDPDSPDASFLLAPTLQSAAAKTLYFMDTQPVGTAGYGMQENGTAPATANFHGTTTGSGWNSGAAAPRFEYMDYATQVGRASLDTTEPAAQLITTAGAGNFFRSPSAYTGPFTAGNWTLNLGVRGTAQVDFTIRWHVWANTDPTGATVATRRQLNSAVIVGTTITATLSTTTVTAVTATWAAPAITLANEYLFFTPYLHITSATGGANTQYINLATASTSRVLTTNFTAAEPDTRARVSFPTPTYGLQSGAGLQEFRALVRKKGTGTSPTADLALYENGSLVSTLASAQIITNTTGQVLSGTFDGSGRNMTQIEADVLGSGTVGGSVEVGALEWNANTTVQQVDAGFLDDSTSLYGATIQKLASDTDLRVSFPTPPDTLITGAGMQEFRVLVRKTAGAGTPTVRLELWENGSAVSGGTLLADTDVTSASGTIHSVTWNATLLSNLTGLNTELRVYGTGVSGGATVEVGAIKWNAMGFTAQVIAGYLGDSTSLYGAMLYGPDLTLSAGVLADATSLFGAQIQGPVLQAGFLGPLTAGPYPAGNWRPQSIASTHELYGATLSSGASGGYERVKPSHIIAMSGLSGTIADIDDDPDDPDQTFLHV